MMNHFCPSFALSFFIAFARIGDGFWLQDRMSIPLAEIPSASPDSFTWRAADGSYKFGMQGDEQWRVERRNPDGSVSGRFAYRTPDGQIVDQSFNSGGAAPEVVQREDAEPEEMADILFTAEEVEVEMKAEVEEMKAEIAEMLREPTLTGSPEQVSDYDFVVDLESPSSSSGIEGGEGASTPLGGQFARPYGALAPMGFLDDDFVDTNSIVDEQTKSIVLVLN